VFASRLARNLRIISFEPNPAAFACLQANAAAWGGTVTCLPVGLSSTDKTAELTFFEGMSLLSGFHADAATEHGVEALRAQPAGRRRAISAASRPGRGDRRPAARVGRH